MPRIPAAVAVVVLVTFSIGFNIFRYEAVWDMLNAPATLTKPADSTPTSASPQPLRTASEKTVPHKQRQTASPAAAPNPPRAVMPPASAHPPAATETSPPAKPSDWPSLPPANNPSNRPARPRDPMEQPIDASPATRYAMASDPKPPATAKPTRKAVSAYKPTAVETTSPATRPNTTASSDPFAKGNSGSSGTALSAHTAGPSEGFGAGSTACPTASRPEYGKSGSSAFRGADASAKATPPRSSGVRHLPPVSEVVQVYPDDNNWRQSAGTVPMYPSTPYPASPISPVQR